MTWNELIYRLKAWEAQEPGILEKPARFFDPDWDTCPTEIDSVDPYDDEDGIEGGTQITVGP